MKIQDYQSADLGAIRDEFTCTTRRFSLVFASGGLLSHLHIRAWSRLQGWVKLRFLFCSRMDCRNVVYSLAYSLARRWC